MQARGRRHRAAAASSQARIRLDSRGVRSDERQQVSEEFSTDPFRVAWRGAVRKRRLWEYAAIGDEVANFC